MNIQEKIQNVLLNLLQVKSIEQITVTEIINNSSVTRTIFYRYYINQYSILQTIENNIFVALEASIDESENGMLKVLKTVDKYKKTVNILLNQNDVSDFGDQLMNFLTVKGMCVINKKSKCNQLNDRQVELLIEYLSVSISSVMKFWMSNSQIAINELDDSFEMIFKNGINNLIGAKS